MQREGMRVEAACARCSPLVAPPARLAPCGSPPLTPLCSLLPPTPPITKQYTYSGLTLQPQGWHPAVAALKARAEAAAGTTFNCCLLNRYRGGDDCIGWHSDNDRLFGAAPTIGER